MSRRRGRGSILGSVNLTLDYEGGRRSFYEAEDGHVCLWNVHPDVISILERLGWFANKRRSKSRVAVAIHWRNKLYRLESLCWSTGEVKMKPLTLIDAIGAVPA